MAQYDNLNYDELLNSCFEIEGLLSLMRLREAESPEEVFTLLKDKVSALAAAFGVKAEAPVEPAKTVEPGCTPEAKVAETVEFEESADADAPKRPDPKPTPEVEIEEELESMEDDPVDEDMTLEAKLARSGSADLRTAFSLNDRYRFRRELFGNSEAQLRDTIDLISAMHSLAEAEEYLYGDLKWDPAGDDVKDFMAIVARHFDVR